MVKTLKVKLNLFFFLLLLLPIRLEAANYLRVLIIPDAETLSIKINSAYQICIDDQKIISRGQNLKVTATASAGGLLIGSLPVAASSVYIKVYPEDELWINSRRFRGSIQITKKENRHLSVVNRVELEDYLKGVLYHEASHYWPKEALKAQAIICRTFALYQAEENKNKDYDLTADIYSQVYGGKTSERYRSNQAIAETSGLVLTYKGRLFPTYYHATCAGATEDASSLWNIDLSVLKGVSCAFCQESPHYHWHYVISGEAMRKILNANGYKLGKIKEIVVLNTTSSGRAKELKIIAEGQEIKISAKDLRNILGPNLIRSTKFSVSNVFDDFIFIGQGWGHGVGLCQWGSYFMAKKGADYQKILKYYYPGSDVQNYGF